MKRRILFLSLPVIVLSLASCCGVGKVSYAPPGPWITLTNEQYDTVLERFQDRVRVKNRIVGLGLPGTNYALHQIFTTWADAERVPRLQFSTALTNSFVAMGPIPSTPRGEFSALLERILKTNGVVIKSSEDGTLQAFFRKDAVLQ